MVIFCPKCQCDRRHNKGGFTRSGKQLYRCQWCRCRHSLVPSGRPVSHGLNGRQRASLRRLRLLMPDSLEWVESEGVQLIRNGMTPKLIVERLKNDV